MPRTFKNSEIFLTRADASFLLQTQFSPLQLENDSEILRKKKNAQSAKKSRQKKNDLEKQKDQEVIEREMELEKVKKQVELRKTLIKRMSSFVFENKLQIFSDAHEDDEQRKVRPESDTCQQQQMQQETSEPHDETYCYQNIEMPLFLSESNLQVTKNVLQMPQDEIKNSIEEANPSAAASNDNNFPENFEANQFLSLDSIPVELAQETSCENNLFYYNVSTNQTANSLFDKSSQDINSSLNLLSPTSTSRDIFSSSSEQFSLPLITSLSYSTPCQNSDENVDMLDTDFLEHGIDNQMPHQPPFQLASSSSSLQQQQCFYIGMDLNDVFQRLNSSSQVILQRINSTVSRMSLEETSNIDDLLDGQLSSDDLLHLMQEVQKDYALNN